MRDQDLGPGVIVALHGHGDEPDSARSWAARVSPAGWEVVAPAAPLDADGVASWFSSGSRGADQAQLSAAVDAVREIATRVRAAGRPLVVVGFSQGGAVALEVARAGRGG
ncbi:MAG: alpha/beta fold hydrolase [Microthrixaceae bacterium]